MASNTGLRILSSPGLHGWLTRVHASLAFSTYQLGKLFFVGCHQTDRLSVFERTFNRCLGLWSDTQSLWLASAYQLWRLENVLAPGAMTDDGYDRLFVPRVAYTTGDVDVHDVAVTGDLQPLFVNTLFSCLATTSDRFNFRPVWQPPFIDRLAAEDRCHLNGLATEAGQPRYVTACAQTNQRGGWRAERDQGGCIVDVIANRTVVAGMSMPHSPRVYRDRLWVLDSGHGYFGRVNLAAGKFEPLVFCPGYARGLAFIDHYAVVGLSRPREATFAGLALDQELARRNLQPGCGLLVIDLDRGTPVEWLTLEGQVDELYDVLVLPGVRRAKALGLKNDDIRHNVWFEDGDTISRWSATEK
jgi:uncharacterized protein (TIGR03032 family)